MKKTHKKNKKNDKKLYGGNNERILIVSLLVVVSIMFGLIVYNFVIKNKTKIVNNDNFEVDNILSPLSDFLKNLANNNQLVDDNILKNISNVDLNDSNINKFIINKHIYIRLPLDKYQ